MSNPHIFRAKRTPTSRSSRRRPTGVSRRQRKKQLGFETLEDRRVMSAQSPLASLQGAVASDLQIEVQSYSSNTAEGQTQILLNELYWQSLLTGTHQIEASSFSIPTDPLSSQQWHLINTGQEVGNPDFQSIFADAGEDINVAPVWNLGITGEGVVVAIIDSGVETLHPDLAANISPTLQFDPLSGDTDPNPDNLVALPINAHGTAVAGLVGAVANNGIGGSGVAPGVTLAPIRLIDGGQFEQAFIDAFRYENQEIDITNNSWGPGVTRGIAGPTADEFLALRDSILFGRKINPTDENGLGIIHVFAAGNNAGTPFDFGFETIGGWDSTTYNGWASSRYTIAVTGVDHDGFYNNVDGTVTGYPEVSAGVLVAAPTGSNAFLNIIDDTGIGSGIWTTDTIGETGFNIAPDPITGQEFDRDYLADTDATSRFNGTSAAAPLVSGVIALMLEVNPNLSYRDVQEILVRSARQNAEFDVPFATGVGTTQNTWIQNQMPVFHDPDVWDPTVNPFLQTFFPTLNPALTDSGFNAGPGANPNTAGQFQNTQNVTGVHYQPTPQTLTNGAGFTVSQGKGVHGELIGYAHGVIDAELAVQLAQQWHTKNQNLPNELTYTSFINPNGGFFINVPAAEVSDDDSGNQLVPGGFGGDAGFVDFWNEYFVDDPFANNPDFNNRGSYVELSVPDNNLMTIENIEVKISLLDNADDLEFLDNMRVTLISPTGTHSELNHSFVEVGGTANRQTVDFNGYAFEESPALASTDTDPLNPGVITFTSNRSWGERSDNAIIFDPTTAEPALTAGNGLHGWQLHFENYSQSNDVGITGVEVSWHGSPIAETGTQRIQGLVGVDDGVDGIGARDDAFNFSRVSLVTGSLPGDDDPTSFRLTEVTNTIDPLHESMGANVTVTARRVSDGVVVSQFVTGADGNYYFDLVPDDYIISVEDAAGRTALDDTLSPAGFLKNFQTEWLITEDYFQVWDYDSNLDVPIDPATGAPFPFLDPVASTPTTYHVNHINFLLDPGAAPAAEVVFSGSTFADINGDGIFNAGDVAVPGVGVFGDVNRNGELDAGEILVTTNAAGEYSLTVPLTNTTVMNVGVRPPADWTPSSPDTGFQSFFVELGDVFTDADFYIQPPAANNTGDGSPSSGIILGTVFDDRNGDMSQQGDEFGVPNQTVYLDANNSGTHDAGEAITQTNINGAYVFANVADGSHFLRWEAVPDSGNSQTFPDFDLPQFATILSGGTASAINFGISSGIVGGVGNLDYGDLPEVYGTLLADDGARHPEGNVFLGSTIDSELDGVPTADALGDDNAFLPDEDGVVLVGGTLIADSTGTLTVTASLFGGYLQAWMDFNDNGVFEVAEQVVVNELLVQGTNTVTFETPAAFVGSTVFARFRLGEFGLGSTGLAQIGEVEDYALVVDPGSIPQVLIHGPDFDEDGDVDGFDFLAWQRGAGTSSNAVAAQGDANSDGAVDGADLAILEQDYGQGSTVSVVVATGDFDSDGDTDGSDFLAFQRGFGLAASLSSGDGNQDGNVDGADLQVWEDSYDEANAAAAFFASQSSSVSATFSSQQTTSVLSVGPSLYQPGFREELVAGVVDTAQLSDRQGFASIASEVERLAARGRRGATPFARLENRREAHQVRVEARAELGLALRDRVWDHISAKRHKTLEEMLPERLEEFEAQDAFAAAFDEEIDWRVG